MITERNLLSANADGTLLSAISKTAYDERDAIAETLSALHNSRSIDFLNACRSNQLGALSDQSLYRFLSVFCSTIQRINCSHHDAIVITGIVSERAGNNIISSDVTDALRAWFQHTPQRANRGLELIQSDINAYYHAVKPVLLAGANHDVRKYATAALFLARQPSLKCRLDAVTSLGAMELAQHEDLYVDAVKCFAEIIETPVSELDQATVIRAGFNLLKCLGKNGASLVEPLLLKVCNSPSPNTLPPDRLGIQFPQVPVY